LPIVAIKFAALPEFLSAHMWPSAIFLSDC
jgi:hypothetical protein